ncbi:MAG: GvpL/GvpF family gas vesicle protein [Deltaproteobacteria bacterium]|nr:GvpL/GvpF family gas vesicle protein [Deltaproteobacteria bacterium]
MFEDMDIILKKLVQEEVQNLIIRHRETIHALVKDMLVSEIRRAIRLEMPALLNDRSGDCDDLSPDNPAPGLPAVAGFSKPSPKPALKNDSPVSRNDGVRTDCRYLYAIAGSEKTMQLGSIGIEDAPVYTIASNGLSAVVHACSSEPYQSSDPEIARGWLLTHQRVVEAAFEQLGDVIPAGFDTILNGEGVLNPDETVQTWLNTEHDALISKLDQVSGKQEYGIQIFWDPKQIAAQISKENEAIRCLNEEIRSKPEGAAYLYRQKLAGMLKNEIEQEADRHFQSFYHIIQPVVDALRIEKIRKTSEAEAHQMIMNLSCLLSLENKHRLGQNLENIAGMAGFSVNFTGPWPPYSFV